MFTFLIVVKIFLLPSQEVHEFKVWSTGQYSQPICSARATELAERIAETASRIPARVMTQATCTLQPTRQT
jgi:hypothetical protein